MKSKIVLGLLLIALLATSVCGKDIVVSPGTLDIDLVGGCSTTKNIIIEYTGSGTITLNIETNITPDSEGIDISYSVDSPFTINAGKPLVISMIINTSMLLMPEAYIITTTFYGKIESDGNGGNGNGETDNLKAFYSPVFGEEEPIDDTGDGVPIQESEDEYIPIVITAKASQNYDWLFLIIIIGLVIIMLLVLYKRRKEKRK